MICPNCNDDADDVRKPGEQTDDIADYDRMCHVGTRHEQYPGHKFYHGVTYE